jgi:Organic solute transporter Ostalpha
MFLHLRNYHRPEFQRYYVRIIFMIPIYSVVSWCLILGCALTPGWDIAFIAPQRTMNSE